MKGLLKYVEKIKPNFEKGGKYQRWGAIFESFETFLFVPGHTAPRKGAHIRDAMDSKRLMSIVVLAVVPALLFGMWNVGYQYFLSIGTDVGFWQEFGHGLYRVLPIIIVSYVAGLGTEFVFVHIKQKEIEEGFLVSGILIPLIIPVDTPLWMVAIATIFAVIIGKEVFGGTGMNIVNPALLTRAFLFFAYPSKMSGDKVWVSRLAEGNGVIDGYSGATPLGQAVENGANIVDPMGHKLSTFDYFIGWIPGSIGETSALMIFIGAALLLYTGVGSWKIMFSAFAGGAVMGLLLNTFASDTNPAMAIPFYDHLLLGGFAFGMVFMATDPVTAAQTEKGKWIYGFSAGFMAILVRVLNPAYPEGVMMAILLMNVLAPLIDHYVIRANVKKRLKRIKVAKIN
jgi:Na+-transporting NADH:ubiquinone oxidoreductase subunit B